MDPSWITTTWVDAAMTAVSAVGIYIAVILYTRLGGLRSFSKMSSFDFAMTVAVGSLVASTVLTPNPALLQAAAALAALYVLQLGVAHLRVMAKFVGRAVDNQPVLLMVDGKMREDAMRRTAVTRDDLVAKLREANVLRLEQVRAVVMETTGDISVLHAQDGDDRPVDDLILSGVEGSDAIAND